MSEIEQYIAAFAVIILMLIFLSVVLFITTYIENYFARKHGKTHFNHTKLTPELARDAIKYNGFTPLGDDPNWISFICHGEKYYLSTDSNTFTMMCKVYTISNDTDVELLKRTAECLNKEFRIGGVEIADELIRFYVINIECTYEHLCISLMELVRFIEYFSEEFAKKQTEIMEEESKLNQPDYPYPYQSRVQLPS